MLLNPDLPDFPDFNDEDTDPAVPEPQRRARAEGEPSYELIWVEEERYGMVLRVRRITPTRAGANAAFDGVARPVGK